MTGTNRRDFIKYGVAGAVAAGCPIDLSLVAQTGERKPAVEGEDNSICHQVRDGKVFTRPPVSAHHDVVIVGGGISGLTSAYLLQHRDFLLLEKEPHWGGNAYLMEFEGNAYSTGAAFLGGDTGLTFAKEIGLEPLPIDNWDGTIVKGQFVPDTWGDGLDKLPYPAAVRESFKKFREEILKIDVTKRGNELFNVPFSDFMRNTPPELKQWWDAYGISNWGAPAEETAATIAVQELQWISKSDRRDLRSTWPGGLGAISKRLVEVLQPKFADRMQAEATTIAVVPEKNEVQVTSMQGGNLKTVAAKAVIMAIPKFIARRLVQGLPAKQDEAMQQMRYIPYPVVNLIFDKPVFNTGYDTWCPGNSFTDFIVADWVVRNKPGHQQKYNIITCYTAMREEDRPRLLIEQGARRIAESVLRDFQKLLPTTNVNPMEVHIYRRGHPMFMSTPKLFTQTQPLARQPMDRVFFANTDSESLVSDANGAISAARRAVKEVEHRLAGKSAPKHKQTASVFAA